MRAQRGSRSITLFMLTLGCGCGGGGEFWGGIKLNRSVNYCKKQRWRYLEHFFQKLLLAANYIKIIVIPE